MKLMIPKPYERFRSYLGVSLEEIYKPNRPFEPESQEQFIELYLYHKSKISIFDIVSYSFLFRKGIPTFSL